MMVCVSDSDWILSRIKPETHVLKPKQMTPFVLILFLLFQTTGRIDGAFAADPGTPKIVIIEFHGLNNNIIQDNLASLPHFF